MKIGRISTKSHFSDALLGMVTGLHSGAFFMPSPTRTKDTIPETNQKLDVGAFKDATGLEVGGPDCEGDTVIEFNSDETINTIDDYWIAATNGSTWEVQFDEFDFTFSLNNDPDD